MKLGRQVAHRHDHNISLGEILLQSMYTFYFKTSLHKITKAESNMYKLTISDN